MSDGPGWQSDQATSPKHTDRPRTSEAATRCHLAARKRWLRGMCWMINPQLHASGHRAHENARYLLRKWTVASRRVPTGSSRLCNVKNCTRSWHFIVPSLVLGQIRFSRGRLRADRSRSEVRHQVDAKKFPRLARLRRVKPSDVDRENTAAQDRL